MDPVTVDRTDRHRREFTASASSLRSMREFVTERLQRAGATSRDVEDVRLVVSELGANAVQHGTGGGVLVCVDVSDQRCWTVSVSNRTAPERDVPRLLRSPWTRVPPHAGSGRGLTIVRDVCDDVTVTVDDDVVTVTCRLRRGRDGRRRTVARR